MPVWLLISIATAVASVSAASMWWMWLRFCTRIAEKYGVDALKALPPLASSYRASSLDSLLPWRRPQEVTPVGEMAGGPDPPQEPTPQTVAEGPP